MTHGSVSCTKRQLGTGSAPPSRTALPVRLRVVEKRAWDKRAGAIGTAIASEARRSVRRRFARHFRTLPAGFRQADGDRLLFAGHLLAAAAPKRSSLSLVHG